MAPPDPGARPADPDLLDALRRRGVLPVEAHRAAAAWVSRPIAPATWKRILDPLGLVLGLTLIVSGVMYLVGWNWSSLGRLGQIGVGATAVAAAGVAALVVGTDRLGGKLLAMAGIPLTFGALSTVAMGAAPGGEPWTLLAIWAGLSAFWAVASRLAVSWLGVLLAIDLTLGTWLAEVIAQPSALEIDLSVLAFGLVHTVAWGGFLAVRALGVPGAAPWVRQVLVVPVLLILAWWAFELLVLVLLEDMFGQVTFVDPLGALLFLVVGVAVQVGFALGRIDVFPAAVQLLTVLALIPVALGLLVFQFGDADVLAMFYVWLGLPITVLVLLGVGTGWLVWGWRRQRAREQAGGSP
jgi:hypothetical protein